MEIRWLTVFLDLPDDGTADAGKAESFWSTVTGTRLSPRRGPAGQFATLLPPDGDAYLRVQRVRAGPGGCHLDLHVDRAAMDAAATEAVAAGARERFREDDVIVLDSPGGFPFCLVWWEPVASFGDKSTVAVASFGDKSTVAVASVGDKSTVAERTVPGPVDGGRLDQLCLDAPPRLFEAEVAFWTTLTGWEPRAGARPEFRSLVRPAGIPVRLLFQRRDDDGGAVTGHVDFACTDRAALADRHVAAGARHVATFPHWITMADPAGRPYCLTGRDPLTGTLS